MSQDGMELASKSSFGGEVRGSAAAVWFASVDVARFDRVVAAYGDYCAAVGAGAVSLGNFIGCESWSGAGSSLVAWDACFQQVVGSVGGSALDASVSGGDRCAGCSGGGAGARSSCGCGIGSRCAECVVTSCRGLVSVGVEGPSGGVCGRRDEGVGPRECDDSLSGCDGDSSLGEEREDVLKVEEVSSSGGVVGGRGLESSGRVDDGALVEHVGVARSKNARKRAAQRARRAAEKLVGASLAADVVVDEQKSQVVGAVEAESVGCGVGPGVAGESRAFVRSDLECVVSAGERKQLAREWYERKRAENALATQRARYNYKRNEYLDRARISEKRWEQERLSCEQKLAKITEARFGSKPGYAETLASISDGSELPPSLSAGTDSPANLSEGTISPNSSMSVAEANRLIKKVEELSGRVVQLELEKKALAEVKVAQDDGGSCAAECWFGGKPQTEYGDCSAAFEYDF